jgi:hypothetical protein
MLETFTVETFATRIREPFHVRLDDGSYVQLALASATAAPTWPSEAPRTRRSFSLVFYGPPHPVLPQRIHRFEHATLGSFDLFIVPIGPLGDAMQYEAVFA